jgi:uncharacterized protein YecE (DUF72 family)
VKIPRTISHDLKLQEAREPFAAFLAQTDGLAEKRGPMLLQLPPSLSFDGSVVTRFLKMVRRMYDGPIVCEPRHATWFSPVVGALMERYRVSRVAADPPPVADSTTAADWSRVAYFRLHGSPRMYWSRYDEKTIAALAATIVRITTAEQIWWVLITPQAVQPPRMRGNFGNT